MKMPNAIAALGANVSLTASSITDLQATPGPAQAHFVMGADGITYQELTPVQTRTALNQPDDWINPKVGMDNYEVFVSNSGDPILAGSDPLDTWLNLGTERNWGVFQNGTGEQTAILAVTVRLATGGLVLAGPTTYTVSAQNVI